MKAKPKSGATKPATKKKIGTDVLVAVVLDRSGSMHCVRESTIAGYNSYLDELGGKSETAYSVTATLFDQNVGSCDLEILCTNAPLAQATRLNLGNYQPRGNTPLYDAIGLTIRATESAAAGRPVVMMIVTDGEENASREFTSDSIKKLIADKEKDGWTFVFMGANIDSYAVSSTLGINVKNVANYAQGSETMAFNAAGAGTVMYASTRIATRSLRQNDNEGFFDHLAKDAKGQVNIGAPDPTITTTGGTPSQWISNQPLTSTGGGQALSGSHRPFSKGTAAQTPPPTTTGNRQHRPLK